MFSRKMAALLKEFATRGLSASITLFLLSACGGSSDSASGQNTDSESNALTSAADQLWIGKIYTMKSEGDWADAIAVKDGKIIYVGDREGALSFQGSSTQVVELPKNSTVLPGLHDLHMHPLEAGSSNLSCAVDGAKPVDDWVAAVQACAASGTGWVLGFGFSMGELAADGRNPLQMMDAVANGRPVAIMEETSHAAWVSSQALELLGFTKHTNNPPGGHIGKDDSGELNGLLFDTAGDMAFHFPLAGIDVNSDKSKRDYEGLIWALEQVRKNGLTSIANARVYWKRGNLEVWKKAVANNELTARTVVGLWFYPEDLDDDAQVAQVADLFDNSNPLFRVDEIKVYDDGIPINSTAAFHAPYLQDLGYGFAANNKGLNYFDEHRLGNIITQLEAVGFRMHIHAIGDRGVTEALNAIEFSQAQNQGKVTPKRHRLTHVEYVSANDYARFAQLNVTADAQVAGDWTLPENHSQHEKNLLGEGRVADQIPLHGLYENNARITLSSDWDVSDLNPFVGMQHALVRGNQILPNVHQVIKAYTLNAAYALAQEDKVGSIEVGKLADLTIIDRDLFAIPVADIEKTQVLYTVLEGDVVFKK